MQKLQALFLKKSTVGEASAKCRCLDGQLLPSAFFKYVFAARRTCSMRLATSLKCVLFAIIAHDALRLVFIVEYPSRT